MPNKPSKEFSSEYLPPYVEYLLPPKEAETRVPKEIRQIAYNLSRNDSTIQYVGYGHYDKTVTFPDQDVRVWVGFFIVGWCPDGLRFLYSERFREVIPSALEVFDPDHIYVLRNTRTKYRHMEPRLPHNHRALAKNEGRKRSGTWGGWGDY